MVIPALDEQIRQLHAGGLDDPSIGRIVRISTQAVWRARERLGLEVNRDLTTPNRVRELHAAGHDDAEIGRMMGFTKTTARYHRVSMGLPNVRVERAGQYDSRIRELHAEGLSDAVISRAVGLCREAVSVRRKAMGLESKHRTSTYNQFGRDTTDYDAVERTALAWRLAVVGRDLATIAEACGVTADEAKELVGRMPKWWRRESGIRDERPVKTFAGCRRGAPRKFKASYDTGGRQ